MKGLRSHQRDVIPPYYIQTLSRAVALSYGRGSM